MSAFTVVSLISLCIRARISSLLARWRFLAYRPYLSTSFKQHGAGHHLLADDLDALVGKARDGRTYQIRRNLLLLHQNGCRGTIDWRQAERHRTCHRSEHHSNSKDLNCAVARRTDILLGFFRCSASMVGASYRGRLSAQPFLGKDRSQRMNIQVCHTGGKTQRPSDSRSAAIDILRLSGVGTRTSRRLPLVSLSRLHHTELRDRERIER